VARCERRTMRMRISFLEKRRWKSLANVMPMVSANEARARACAAMTETTDERMERLARASSVDGLAGHRGAIDGGMGNTL